MINKWSTLSQNNKIALLVVPSALLTTPGYFGKLWFDNKIEPEPVSSTPVNNGRITVTRETPEESTFSSNEVTLITNLTNTFGKKLGMTYFAAQEVTQIYSDLGIGYFDTSKLNVPATYIIAPGEGWILFKHALRDYTKRTSDFEIITELSRINN